jgi:hypothetical protein
MPTTILGWEQLYWSSVRIHLPLVLKKILKLKEHG